MSSLDTLARIAVSSVSSSSSSDDQSSSSSSANHQSSSARSRRSSAVNSAGRYEEWSDDEFDSVVFDNFVVEEEEDEEKENDTGHKRRKTNTPSTPVDRQPFLPLNLNTNNATTDEQKRKKNPKKTASSSSSPAVDKLEWTQTKEAISHGLPVFKTRPDTITYRDYTPIEMFSLFFTDIWKNRVVDLMNSYHVMSGRWNINTNVPEILAFIGVHIYMGIHNLPRIDMYWHNEHQHPFVSSLFTRDRFQLLNAAFCLHTTDNGLAVDDPIIHTKDFVDHINRTCPLLDIPTQHMSFDEAMCAYTGRSTIKQYLPAKPHPYGYKWWCLGNRKYIRRIELYAGASDEVSEDGKMCDLMNRMLEGYENRHHILYCDNWFTSTNLLTRFLAKKIYLCGSVNLNRLKLAAHSPLKQDFNKTLKRFESQHWQCGDMQLVVWKDNKVIKVLYNHISPHSPDTTVTRYTQEHERMEVPCPKALHDYFHRARDIDIYDQLCNSYIIGRKSMNQRTRLVWWLVNLCIVNAYTLHERSHTDLTQLRFRLELAKSLATQHYQVRRHASIKRVSMGYLLLAHEHYSVLRKVQRDCVVCSDRKVKRRQTCYWCECCDKAMCLGKCFSTYHAQQHIQTTKP